jgi:hypothetical protein
MEARIKRTSKAPGTGADDIQADIRSNGADDIQATIERTSKAILSTFRRQSDATLKHLSATIKV